MKEQDLVTQICEIIRSHSESPADELIKNGTALVNVGSALKGIAPVDCEAIITAVSSILKIMPNK